MQLTIEKGYTIELGDVTMGTERSLCSKCDHNRVVVTNKLDSIIVSINGSDAIANEDKDTVVKYLSDAKECASKDDITGITTNMGRASQHLISHSAMRYGQREIGEIIDKIDDMEHDVEALKNMLSTAEISSKSSHKI